jgi:Fe-S-cluster containining protein
VVRRNWFDHLHALRQAKNNQLPLHRIHAQAVQDSRCRGVLSRWSHMEAAERLAGWRELVKWGERHVDEIIPACVRCGDCCRSGSPTLHLDDLELLRNQRIPWNLLVTLRQGEPVYSPFENRAVVLLDERVKLREKASTRECVLYDDTRGECLVYEHRPVQCRAQACWDPERAREMSKLPYLTRRDLFQDLDLLLELIAEHDRRCSFTRLQEAFRQVAESQGERPEDLVDVLAYEEHFREFLAAQLGIPRDILPLIFGRSFADLLPLFGCRVENDDTGKKHIVPDRGAPSSGPRPG